MTEFNQANKELSSEALEQIALRFKLLSDPMRLKILHALQEGEQSVNQLVKVTGSSQPNISKHLNILRTTGMVKRRQESNQAFFSISAPFIFDLCEIVCNGIAEELEQLKSSFS
ncbi:ArsR/SmtB family transcription factor [Alkalimarinus sediminis]|uniref:Metalloregulator ArsR/SmtB family transcription factor n=1 Tax=Alkalimarinus sediminis TaxID=1632866 RepID=A0A9E8KPG1_9ALTE|nr:metalloregulator ArsR/SmtB family transcription factor [Alkalimarinus sediminis]UZW73462.1 metalloregulator ArsR/SmtB family transcription factor [Alkalimarinus sediminis]